MRPQTTVSFITSFFFVVGLGLLAGTGYLTHSQYQFIQRSIKTTGTVVELETSTSRDSDSGRLKTYYHPIVEFQTSTSNTVRFRGDVGSHPSSYDQGEHVPVRYLPNQPQAAKLDTFFQLWFLPIILGFMGSLCTVLCGFFLWMARKRKQDIAWLTQHGQRVRADISRIEQNRSLTVNGTHPYRIIAYWQNPATQQMQELKSENIWFDPTAHVNQKQIEVLMDVNNPTRYVMDTGFLPKEG